MQKTGSSHFDARLHPGSVQPGSPANTNRPPANPTASMQNVPAVFSRRRQREVLAGSPDAAEGPVSKRIRLDTQNSTANPEFSTGESTETPQQTGPLSLAIPLTHNLDNGKFEVLRTRIQAGQIEPGEKAQLLQETAYRGKRLFFNLLLEFGALAEYKKFHQGLVDRRKCTLFQCAVIGQDLLLLDRLNEVDGPMVERPDSELKDALKIAAFKGGLKFVELLCDAIDYKRIKWTLKDMSEFLDAAAQLQHNKDFHYSEDYPVIALLARRNPNSMDRRVCSKALFTAVKSANWEAASVLLGVYGANPNATDSHGLSLLMTSAAAGKFDIYKLLRFHDASPYAIDDAGNSVLVHAVHGGNEEIVLDLVQRCKVDLRTKNQDGQSAFDLAQQRNQPHSFVSMLRYRPDAQDGAW